MHRDPNLTECGPFVPEAGGAQPRTSCMLRTTRDTSLTTHHPVMKLHKQSNKYNEISRNGGLEVTMEVVVAQVRVVEFKVAQMKVVGGIRLQSGDQSPCPGGI